MWRKAKPDDLTAVMRLLLEAEERHIGVVDQMRPDAGAPAGTALPPLRVGTLFVHASHNEIDALLLRSASGTVRPMCRTTGVLPSLALRRRTVFGLRRTAAVLGVRDDVIAFLNAVGLVPSITIDYLQMAHSSTTLRAVELHDEVAHARCRVCSVDDLDALMPLQELYEKEEVLIDPSEFDRGIAARHLRGRLIHGTVVAAFIGGRPVAKAETNAVGVRYDQIGGVFTLPSLRGYGLAGLTTSYLQRAVAKQGKATTLFVKIENTAARAVYRKLGYNAVGAFRIVYT